MKYNSNEIEEIIPHRYPFLLVDKIIDGEIGKWAKGVKNVTRNEEFFNGHFPDYHVMPGVLIIEALAQVGAVSILADNEYRGRLALFAGIKNARFFRQVVPGDSIILECSLERIRSNIGFAKAKASVDGEKVCEADLIFALS